MTTPTPGTPFSNTSGTSSVSTLGATLPTVIDGDVAVFMCTSTRGAGAWTGNAPSGWTLLAGGSAGDTSASATNTTQVWGKRLTAADSGTTVTVNASLSGLITIGGEVFHSGVFEQISAVNKTTTAANPVDAGITPIADDCLRVIISGYVPATGVSTTLTPPASPGTWTEQLEIEDTASTTFRPGVYIATTPLTGQHGSAQGAATITASTKPNANTYAFTIAPAVRKQLAANNRAALVRASTY